MVCIIMILFYSFVHFIVCYTVLYFFIILYIMFVYFTVSLPHDSGENV